MRVLSALVLLLGVVTQSLACPFCSAVSQTFSEEMGTMSVVAIVMCAMLVLVIQEVAGLVESMRHDESSIRQGMELSTAVREMSIHIAHSVLEGDESVDQASAEVAIGLTRAAGDLRAELEDLAEPAVRGGRRALGARRSRERTGEGDQRGEESSRVETASSVSPGA